MGRIVYFCYGDRPTGIIRSQAIDVVRAISALGTPAALAVAVPMRGAAESKRSFLRLAPDAQVTFALPTRMQAACGWLEAMRIGAFLRRMRPRAVICRNPIAAAMVLRSRRRSRADFAVCLDGRGAIAAEQEEYGIHPGFDAAEIAAIEREAVLGADARIAVTEELVSYWAQRYGYRGDRHVVIPTTLDGDALSSPQDAAARAAFRETLGIPREDVVFAYAGSNAGWQGLEELLDEVEAGLQRTARSRFVFLTDATPRLDRIESASGGRFIRRRVPPSEVHAWLGAADFGLLLRKPSVTNQVSFPTKYAEYLAAGMRVVCNGPPAVAAHVRARQTGIVVGDHIPWEGIGMPSDADRAHAHAVACADFSKSAHSAAYLRLIGLLS